MVSRRNFVRTAGAVGSIGAGGLTLTGTASAGDEDFRFSDQIDVVGTQDIEHRFLITRPTDFSFTQINLLRSDAGGKPIVDAEFELEQGTLRNPIGNFAYMGWDGTPLDRLEVTATNEAGETFTDVLEIDVQRDPILDLF